MTLVEELETAAELAEAAGRKTGTLDSITEGNLFAAQLRARVEWIRGMERGYRTPTTEWAKGVKAGLIAITKDIGSLPQASADGKWRP